MWLLDSVFDDVKRMDKRQFLYQLLSFGMIVSSALMIWKGLMVFTGSESPIVVVLSGSMEPAFHRGDLLFLTNYENEDIRVGEIVVFKVIFFSCNSSPLSSFIVKKINWSYLTLLLLSKHRREHR